MSTDTKLTVRNGLLTAAALRDGHIQSRAWIDTGDRRKSCTLCWNQIIRQWQVRFVVFRADGEIERSDTHFTRHLQDARMLLKHAGESDRWPLDDDR